MNPLTTLVAFLVGAWAVADLALLPRRRSLRIELAPSLAPAARVIAVVLAVANWIYLAAAGR
jgi:hypothetical protein